MFLKKNNKYLLKRISNDGEIIIISIFNGNVDFKCIRSSKKINNLSIVEKDRIVNDIINMLNSNNLIELINFDEFSKIIKATYINLGL